MFSDPAGIAVAALIFLAAGTVKGVVGFGLPTVCLALFALTSGLIEAMALLLWPSFITNLIQGLQGGRLMALTGRLKWTLVPAFGFIFVGALGLSRFEPATLSLLLGLLIIAYALLALSGWKPRLDSPAEGVGGIVAGALNGVFTGLTGSFVVPGVLYLNAIGLTRDEMVQAMGILFTVSTLGLGVALTGQGLLSSELSWVSLAGVIPALIGMSLGRRLRQRLPEPLFRRVFLLALLGLGASIALRAGLTA